MKLAVAQSVTLLSAVVGSTAAFQVPRQTQSLHRMPSSQKSNRNSGSNLGKANTRSSTSLRLVTPETAQALVDHHPLLLSNLPSATLLSDTAAAAADDPGFWGNYYNIFKQCLEAVHAAIDPVLRNVGVTQTWGISIAIFTAIVRTILLPLSIQQSKSAEYMKALKPYVTEITQKFKDNDDQKNRALGKLYEDANQNPLSGCLLSLAQLPILLGLYRGIRNLAIDGELNEPFLWIPSLEGPVHGPDYRDLDWLLSGWTFQDSLPIPSLGWETTLAFLVMPVLLVLGQSFSMSTLTPEPDKESMSAEELDQFEKSQRVLKFLPLLIGFFSLQVPAGLTIYWFTTNLYTLAQAQSVKAYYAANPPEINLPDYWDALDDLDTMSPEEQREAAKAGLAQGPKWEDLIVEAKFHPVVERSSLRASSQAWQRVASKDSSPDIAPELQEWVNKMTTASGSTPVDSVDSRSSQTNTTSVETAAAGSNA